MGTNAAVSGSELHARQNQAIRFLVESALRRVTAGRQTGAPPDRSGWVLRLTESLMSEAETSHRAVLASMMSHGIGTPELHDYYIPAAARHLGELWVRDLASFVDVTVGAGRLQALYRERPNGVAGRFDRCVPMGETMLMIVPGFEDHSLGAFVAAEQLRRHGVWVHMGLGLTSDEIAELLREQRFSVLGLSAATPATLEKTAELVDELRSRLDHVPPIVVGGRAVTDTMTVADRTGADYAVRTAREAVERCGLKTIAAPLAAETMG
ncbi:cobalamin B12-binding domain-containing protein [Marinibacterium profundimaris]|uniref:cobalamin B12-binding domain-containing protein n=1 Tax=Marinibacterium profundimaris TaxID=1679460 RepID=UPI000B52174A|nr:cobalamin B12-binding domain-containing protein [Marinibacterium profundimaris]